ncbi:MAG TPA: CBS domain-containing protein [Ferruginibacter sp.]|nr:CBS domain-containing protein [Ferruginibacter sp.]
MSKKAPISDVMTQQVIVANINNKFSQFMEFFNTWRIQHMPVTMGNTLVGILSINDLLGFLYRQLSEGKPVDNATLDSQFDVQTVMTLDPVTIAPNDSIEKAFNILAEGKFQAMPVVSEGKLVGIITNKDMVRLYPDLI